MKVIDLLQLPPCRLSSEMHIKRVNYLASIKVLFLLRNASLRNMRLKIAKF